MANRIPLIVDSSSQRIKELPSGDNLDLTGNGISAVRDILPEADSLYDLGSASKQWKDLYLSGSSIKLGGLTISRSGNSVQFSVSGLTSTLPIADGLSYATITGTETLTNKTFTSPSINGGTITNLSSITTTGNGTIGGDLTVTGDLTVNGTTTTISTTNLAIEDKNIVLADGSNTDAAANGGGITLKGLTDKTITYNSTADMWQTNIGLDVTGQVNATYFRGAVGQVITEFSNDTAMGGVDPGATDAVPTENAVKVFVQNRKDATETLTNKTIDFTNNTILATIAQLNTAVSDADLATLAGTETLTNKTLTSPVISSITNTGTLTLPTSTDTLIGRATTDTLTNKTINLLNNTVSGTIAQFNTALSDADFATLAGTETLSNKTLSATTIAGNLIPNANETYDLGSSANRFRDLYLRGTSIYLADAKLMFHTGKLRMNTNSAGNYPAGDDIEMPNTTAVTQQIKTQAPNAALPFVIALGGI